VERNDTIGGDEIAHGGMWDLKWVKKEVFGAGGLLTKVPITKAFEGSVWVVVCHHESTKIKLLESLG
jgi:hypothetical protein